MRKIIAITQITLDGVMQGPGGPEEDPRNGFTHGGWAMPFLDDALNQAIGETIAGEFDMVLGRRTYEIFAAYWPNQGDNPIANRPTRLGEFAAPLLCFVSLGRTTGAGASEPSFSAELPIWEISPETPEKAGLLDFYPMKPDMPGQQTG